MPTPEEIQRLVDLGWLKPPAAPTPPTDNPVPVGEGVTPSAVTVPPSPVQGDPFAAGAAAAGITPPAPPPVPPSGPAAAAGSLAIDAGRPVQPVSVPIAKRPDTLPAASPAGPKPVPNDGIIHDNPYEGTENPYGGPNIKTPPAAPAKPLSASNEYLQFLEKQGTEADDLARKKVDAVQTEADAQKEKNTAVSAGKLEALATAQHQLAESQRNMAEAQRQADQDDAEAKQRALDIRNMKVDPDRYVHSKSTFQKIMMGISIGLGAFGHGSNAGLDIVNAGIQHDIDAQKQDIQNAKDSNAELAEISKRRFGRAMSMAELDSRNRRRLPSPRPRRPMARCTASSTWPSSTRTPSRSPTTPRRGRRTSR
jgi:hypothetical protein